VLTDDGFDGIVTAVREGRTVHDNIRKTVAYLLTGNFAEIGIMFGAALAGWPLPLVPLQLLWVNLVTDGLPALALVVDPPEAGVLSRPPRDPRARLLGRREWTAILLFGAIEAAVVLAMFGTSLAERGARTARALAFTTLVFSELLRVFAARDPSRTFLETRPLSNLKLLAVVVLSAAAQLGILHAGPLRRIFDLPPLTAGDVAACAAAALIPVSVAELFKLARRAAASRGAGSAPGQALRGDAR
jgi:Ca2+-transporting ATPase